MRLPVGRAVADIEEGFGAIALAILNAGTFQPVEAFTSAVFRTHIELNVVGAVHCLAAVLPSMRGRKLGQIAITGSIFGFFSLFSASAYGLTKAGLINMAEALAPELCREGICLQICNLGFVATPLTARSNFPMRGMMTEEAAGKLTIAGCSAIISRSFSRGAPPGG
jgi:NAD(P)-dependent dehydrogenase (short-subunit alcohol dehydrogenase family)